jgi:hypothetical protein
MSFDPTGVIERSKELRGGNPVEGCKLLLGRGADGTIAFLDQVEERVICALCDIDRQRLFVERRDIMSGEIGEHAIERSMLGVRGAQCFFPEGFVGSKAGMLAGQPIAKITQDIAPSRNVEEATAYSTRVVGFASILD